jgi:hypothetical protein
MWLNTILKRKKRHLTRSQERVVMAAIKAAEKASSGEIRLFVESHCGDDIAKHTVETFHKLGMQQTRERNAVLIYVALKDRVFSIYGDKGIHEKLGFSFWNTEAATLQSDLQAGNDLAESIAVIIRHIGDKLQVHFPHPADDTNELPDRPVYGN